MWHCICIEATNEPLEETDCGRSVLESVLGLSVSVPACVFAYMMRGDAPFATFSRK